MSKQEDLRPTLKTCADLFWKIGAALEAQRILNEERPMTAPLRASIEANVRDLNALKKLTADGFELCVRALAAMGEPNITIFECSPTEEP